MAEALPFDYQVIRKPNIKHLYLRIRSGEVIVTANKYVPEEEIAQFVRAKSSWILKHLSKAVQIYDLTAPNAQIYLLGKAFPVRIHRISSYKKSIMKIENDTALFYLSQRADHAALVLLRDTYYKAHCPAVITPLIEKVAEEMQRFPTKISYRHNRSRWGSCSAKDTLSLNTRLMMLPETMIVYIIVHELAHIRHKNHSSAFWTLVSQYCPDYKVLRQSIRTFELLL